MNIVHCMTTFKELLQNCWFNCIHVLSITDSTCRFRSYALVFSRNLLLHGVRTVLDYIGISLFVFLLTAVCLSCIKAAEGTLPGFVEYMYKHILPACFLAPLKPTFDLNDGHSFLVGQAVQNNNFNASAFLNCIANSLYESFRHLERLPVFLRK